MTTTTLEPQARTWTRREYYQLAEQGWFTGQRVQLIHGEIIQMPQQRHDHAAAICKAERILQDRFEPSHHVRNQAPLNVGADSDPEPDVAVVAGTIEDYSDHPTTAILVVEVSDSSLRLDRRKAALYAWAGVGEYWIINLPDQCLEVYRNPIAANEPGGEATYADRRVLGMDAEVTPHAAPSATPIKISSLFLARRTG